MYGYDGEMTLIQWAEFIGFAALKESEKKKLIADGHYTEQGHRIFTPTETTSLDPPSTSNSSA